MRTFSSLPCLCVAIALTVVGCSTAPTSPAGTVPFSSRLTAQQAQNLAIHAIGLIGTPYVGAGNTPEQGFDCSGLISYVYRSNTGITPPRTVRELNHVGQAVSAANARSGDLVLFGPKGGIPTHAGIYIGEGRFVHAPSTGGRVRLNYVNDTYWSRQNPKFRRL